jgi:phage terminase small subunit
VKNDKKSVHQRRTRFIKEYLLDQNATRAAIAAGYAENSAKVTGSRLLTDANVRAEIEAKNEQINQKLEITVERVKLELARLAFFDPLAFWNENGTAKPIHEVDEDARRAIAGFEAAELFEGTGQDRGLAGYIKKFKLADKGLNLERLGRHLQMFPTKVDVNATIAIHKVDDGNLEDRIAQLERDLGLARAIDEAGRIGLAEAGAGETQSQSEDTPVLP